MYVGGEKGCMCASLPACIYLWYGHIMRDTWRNVVYPHVHVPVFAVMIIYADYPTLIYYSYM